MAIELIKNPEWGTLPGVTVSVSQSKNHRKPLSRDAVEIADVINNGLGVALDTKGGIIALEESLKSTNVFRATKILGTASGTLGLVKSGIDFVNKPSVGSFLKVVWDIAILSTGPVGGIIDGVFDATGYKDKMLEAVDEFMQNN